MLKGSSEQWGKTQRPALRRHQITGPNACVYHPTIHSIRTYFACSAQVEVPVRFMAGVVTLPSPSQIFGSGDSTTDPRRGTASHEPDSSRFESLCSKYDVRWVCMQSCDDSISNGSAYLRQGRGVGSAVQGKGPAAPLRTSTLRPRRLPRNVYDQHRRSVLPSRGPLCICKGKPDP